MKEIKGQVIKVTPPKESQEEESPVRGEGNHSSDSSNDCLSWMDDIPNWVAWTVFGLIIFFARSCN